MNIEKNTLYQIIIVGLIILILLLSFVIYQVVLIYPLVIIAGLILLILIRKKGNIDDERTIKISEKASEKTIIVFIFGSILLLFTSPLLHILTDLKISSYRWFVEIIGSMFQSAIIMSFIYLVFYVYYRHTYGGF